MTSQPVAAQRIAMVLPTPDHSSQGSPTWKSVSVRVRCTEIAPWLGRYGAEVHLILEDNLPDRLADGSLERVDVFVIPQSLTTQRPVADALLEAGKCVIVDICDDVTRYSDTLDDIWGYAQRGAAITVPTPTLADTLRAKTDVPIHVVHDAVEGPPRPTRAPRKDGPLRLFWYGWQHKVRVLLRRVDSLKEIAADGRRIELVVMTDMHETRTDLAQLMASGDARLTVIAEPWSLDGFDAAMAACDIALIPFDTSIDFSGRSPLKLMQALWQGRIAISEDPASYPDFARFGVLHTRIADGIRTVAADPDRAQARLRAAQGYIRDTYMPSVLARRWQAVYDAVLGSFRG